MTTRPPLLTIRLCPQDGIEVDVVGTAEHPKPMFRCPQCNNTWDDWMSEANEPVAPRTSVHITPFKGLT